MNTLTAPASQPLTLRTTDGVELGGTLFRAVEPRGVVLVAGAMATPHRYYHKFATWLSEQGFTVLTFDYRGVGASRRGGLRGHPATMRDWGTHDMAAAVDALRATAPALPLYVVAHSFGGQALALSDALAGADGVLTIGSQLGWWGNWPGVARGRMWLTWNVMFPVVLGTVGYIPGALIGEDLPPGVAAEWARWCRSPNYLYDHVAGAAERARGFTGHAQVWAISDDDYGPEKGVRALASRIGPDGAWVRVVSPARVGGRPIGHFGPFREAFRDTLWVDVADTLDGWGAVRA